MCLLFFRSSKHLQQFTHLGHHEEAADEDADEEIDPEDPAKKNEVGGDAGAKMTLNLLDAHLPGGDHHHQIGQFASQAIDGLGLKDSLFRTS